MWNPFQQKTPEPAPPDYLEEHHIILPGIDIAFNHTTKTAYMIDQTGAAEVGLEGLRDLELWLKDQGWFLHCVSLKAPTKQEPKTEAAKVIAEEIERATHGR
jgi:hypothetical protein